MDKERKTLLTKSLFNIVAVVIAACLIFNTIMLLMAGIDSSKLFSALFGFGLLIFVFLYDNLHKKKKKLAKIAMISFIAFLISLVIIEGIVISKANQKTDSGDVVIVLGAGLYGNSPGPLLKKRLDTAYVFLVENPQALCVVSGGQGPDEVDSEANVMARYLISKGIDNDRIIREDKSVNTLENFTFSKILIDEYFGHSNYQSVYVTNTFHVYRSGLIAKEVGIESQGLSAPAIKSSEFNYFLREYCALIFHWLFRSQ